MMPDKSASPLSFFPNSRRGNAKEVVGWTGTSGTDILLEEAIAAKHAL